FTYDNLDDLLATYERLAALDIRPIAPIHHGMTLSLYYSDPDGTQCELQVDVMTADEAEAFMASDVFAANPIGVEFDPADLVARRASGESISS
ncbi:MAG: VOC family protein, partial [Acidimicrobiales bacterium]